MRFGLIAVCFAFMSAGIAQESPEMRFEGPAELSVPGRMIAFRTIDPAMTRIEEQQLLTRLHQPWGQQSHCSDLQQFAAMLNNILPTNIDQSSLQESGLSNNQPINVEIHAHETPIGLLGRLLPEMNLTWSIRSGICSIETTETAAERQVVRVYDVTPLLANLLEKTLSSHERDEVFYSLANLIQNSVHPDIWEDLGGPSTMAWMTINNRCLLVIATNYEVHLTIESLLSELNSMGYPISLGHPKQFGDPTKSTRRGLPKFGHP